MSVYAQHQIVPKLIVNGNDNIVSPAFFTQDFPTIQVSLSVSLPSNFELAVYQSNQRTIPNFSIPASASNQWTEVAYTDLGTGVNYSVGFEYNPSGVPNITKIFNVQTIGARWCAVAITNYIEGNADLVQAELFNNN